MGELPNVDGLQARANMNAEKPPDGPSKNRFPDGTALEQQVYETSYNAARALVDKNVLQSENKQLRAELHEANNHDSLTGLLNLQGISTRIAEKITSSEERSFGILMIDFNKFKPVNDTHGHDVGNIMLTSFADKLHETVRHSNGDRAVDDIAHLASVESALIHDESSSIFNVELPDKKAEDAARVGGDEFVVIVDLSTTEENKHLSPRGRLQAAETRVRGIFPEIAKEDERFANVDAAIGAAVWVGGSVEEILREADHQMYADKPEGSR